MGHRNDDKYAALLTLTAQSDGQIDDLEELFHAPEGTSQDNDRWQAYFLGALSEVDSRDYNDLAYDFLIAEGMTPAALPDMWAELWASGGPSPPVTTNNVVYGLDNVVSGANNVVTA